MDRCPSRRFASCFQTLVTLMLCLFGLVGVRTAHADFVTYTNATQFNTAISGRTPTTVNFDTSADGTVIAPNSVYQQIIFDPTNAVNGDLIVTNGNVSFSPGLKTFSGLNYLGSSIGDVIKQTFTFNFQTPMNSVGLYIISPSQLNNSEVGITVGTTTALINIADEINLGPSAGNLTPSFAYFLGIVQTFPLQGFTSVTVNPNRSGIVDGVGIDNISFTAVPEPGTLWSALAGLLMGWFGWKRRKVAYATRPCAPNKE